MIRLVIPVNWLIVANTPYDFRLRIKDVNLPDMPTEIRETFSVEIDSPFLNFRDSCDNYPRGECTAEAYLVFADEADAAFFKLTYL